MDLQETPSGKTFLPVRSLGPKAWRAFPCPQDSKAEGKCQQTSPREKICHQAGWGVTLSRVWTSRSCCSALPRHPPCSRALPSASQCAAPPCPSQGTRILQLHLPPGPQGAFGDPPPAAQSILPRWGTAHELLFLILFPSSGCQGSWNICSGLHWSLQLICSLAVPVRMENFNQKHDLLLFLQQQKLLPDPKVRWIPQPDAIPARGSSCCQFITGAVGKKGHGMTQSASLGAQPPKDSSPAPVDQQNVQMISRN